MISIVLTLVIALVIVGGVLWLVSVLPIDATIKRIASGVVVIAVVLYLLFWLMDLFGSAPHYGHWPH